MSSLRSRARLLAHLLVLRPLVRLFFGLTVGGRENLRGLDGFVLAANHNSHLDVLLLYAALPLRLLLRTHPVAARDYFARSRLVLRLMEWLFEPIWVERVERTGDPLAGMRARLDEGRSLILFPEGTRGEPGRLGEFRRGLERLIESRPAVPVVPAFILGPERALPRGAAFPLPVWNHVLIGPPQEFRGGGEGVTEAVRDAVAGLGRAATARRHRRRARAPEAIAIAVIGIDGSGKSTLARNLARELSSGARVCLIGDALELLRDGGPTTFQPLLKEKVRLWLAGEAKRARSLAGYKLPKLAEMLLRDRLLGESRRWYGPVWTVLDGLPVLNLTAWTALYRQERIDDGFCCAVLRALVGEPPPRGADSAASALPELRTLRRLGLAHLLRPDAIVFLDVPPPLALARIEARGAPRQVHENLDQLARLRDAYDLVCAAASREWGVPVLRLGGDRTPEGAAQAARDFTLAAASRRERGGADAESSGRAGGEPGSAGAPA